MTATKIAGWIFILIVLFLFFSNWQASVGIIQTIAKNSIRGIQVLQGREPTA